MGRNGKASMERNFIPAEALMRHRITVGPLGKSGRFRNVLSGRRAACAFALIVALFSTAAFAQDAPPVLTVPALPATINELELFTFTAKT